MGVDLQKIEAVALYLYGFLVINLLVASLFEAVNLFLWILGYKVTVSTET
jgi:hypothetical protein